MLLNTDDRIFYAYDYHFFGSDLIWR